MKGSLGERFRGSRNGTRLFTLSKSSANWSAVARSSAIIDFSCSGPWSRVFGSDTLIAKKFPSCAEDWNAETDTTRCALLAIDRKLLKSYILVLAT